MAKQKVKKITLLDYVLSMQNRFPFTLFHRFMFLSHFSLSLSLSLSLLFFTVQTFYSPSSSDPFSPNLLFDLFVAAAVEAPEYLGVVEAEASDITKDLRVVNRRKIQHRNGRGVARAWVVWLVRMRVIFNDCWVIARDCWPIVRAWPLSTSRSMSPTGYGGD
jgi:hypothetical protein